MLTHNDKLYPVNIHRLLPPHHSMFHTAGFAIGLKMEQQRDAFLHRGGVLFSKSTSPKRQILHETKARVVAPKRCEKNQRNTRGPKVYHQKPLPLYLKA